MPSPLQRIRADDLLAAVFPQQAACLEHIVGDIKIPEHPFIEETLKECLTEALDVEGLEGLLHSLEAGEIECHSIDTREPSPFSQEILNANPYAYLDDAPLEERRTRAVLSRRVLPEGGEDLAQLDASAIREVREESWPTMRGREEVHDALLTLLVMPETELEKHTAEISQLAEEGRAISFRPVAESQLFWSSVERFQLFQQIYSVLEPVPKVDRRVLQQAQWEADAKLDRAGGIAELVSARLASGGPAISSSLSAMLELPRSDIEQGLHALETRGSILRGQFTPGGRELDWCDRRLLARIHRRTIGRLRREIQPVSADDFMRFLLQWHGIGEQNGPSGVKGTALVLDQLQGLELPAAAWEKFVLPARVSDYQNDYLDQLCLSGQFTWARLTPPAASGETEAGSRKRRVRPTKLASVSLFLQA